MIGRVKLSFTFTGNNLSMRVLVLFCVGMMCLVCAMGCGRAPTGPVLISVEGKLVIDGQPAGAGISVSFVPDRDKGTKGPQSSGVTSADGKFILLGLENKNGAVVGHHKVVVKCPFNVMQGSAGDGSTPSATSQCEIAPSYGAAETTPVTIEVKAKADDNKNVVIDVKSK